MEPNLTTALGYSLQEKNDFMIGVVSNQSLY